MFGGHVQRLEALGIGRAHLLAGNHVEIVCQFEWGRLAVNKYLERDEGDFPKAIAIRQTSQILSWCTLTRKIRDVTAILCALVHKKGES